MDHYYYSKWHLNEPQITAYELAQARQAGVKTMTVWLVDNRRNKRKRIREAIRKTRRDFYVLGSPKLPT